MGLARDPAGLADGLRRRATVQSQAERDASDLDVQEITTCTVSMFKVRLVHAHHLASHRLRSAPRVGLDH